jgi:putative membrane protein
MMLMLLGTSRSSSANKPQTAYQVTPSRFPPSRIAVDKKMESSMMFPGWGMGGWMMASYGFVVLLILIGIVVALVALSRRTGRGGPAVTPTATELLAQRHARGEIDDDEYFQRPSVLDSRP